MKVTKNNNHDLQKKIVQITKKNCTIAKYILHFYYNNFYYLK